MARNEGVTVSQSVSVVAQRKLRFLCGAAILICAMPLLASRPYVVDNNVALLLQHGAAPGEKLILGGVPVVDGNPTTLELERFEVWAPQPQILVYEADGKTTHTLPRPATRYYKGHIAGDPDSVITIAVEPNGKIDGSIIQGERMFTIAQGVRHDQTPSKAPGDDSDISPRVAAPLMVREFDPVEDLVANPGAGEWHCDSDGLTLNSVRQALSASKASAIVKANGAQARSGQAITPNGTPTSGVSYGLNLAIETDGELWAAFNFAGGGSAQDNAVTAYIGLLVAKASVIYQRDLSTTLTVGTLHLWQNASTDPWTVTTSSTTAAAISEFALYWHNNYSSVKRSSAVFVSGKTFFGGIAWEDFLCQTDFFCGATGSNCGSSDFANSYAGGYAFCGSSVVTTTVPDPTATVNGVQFGLPTTNDFWMLLEVAHELGHNANGQHTHCIPLSSGQQTLYGVPGRTFVDLCYNLEGGCYAGTESAPAEKGTIMSYCHNIFYSGSFRASRYLFYKAGEADELQLGDTSAKCVDVGSAPCRMTAGLINSTPSLNATITIIPNLPCAPAQTASVPPNGAATFSWQISGGTITAGSTSSTMTFTPNAASVTVTVSVTNASGCSIINSATVSSACGAAPAAPTNVVATAVSSTSVSITWTASTGATSYTVYRSANNSTYSSVGTPGTNSLTDNSASANTAYLYKVTATGPGGTSGDSNKDFATTVIFTDPTLTVNTTTVKSVHVNELRTAVNAMLALSSHSAATYTDTTITAGTSLIHGVDITELRTNLNNARGFIGFSTITFTDPTITAGTTPIKAVHVNELRAGTQ